MTLFLTLLDVVLSVLAVVMASWALITAEEVERDHKRVSERLRFLERRAGRW